MLPSMVEGTFLENRRMKVGIKRDKVKFDLHFQNCDLEIDETFFKVLLCHLKIVKNTKIMIVYVRRGNVIYQRVVNI